MQKRSVKFLVPSVALVLALVGMLSASFVFAKGDHASSSALAPSAKAAIARTATSHTVNMQSVPAEARSAAAARVQQLPFLTGVSSTVYAQRKAAAAHSKNAPLDTSAIGAIDTPTTTAKFAGQGDTCSCQPPDQALAASSSWVLQGVNV